MRLGLSDVRWSFVGAKLAQEDDEAQAEFFKAFIKECKTWGTHYQIEMQLAGINRKLTKEEREVLSMLSYDEP